MLVPEHTDAPSIATSASYEGVSGNGGKVSIAKRLKAQLGRLAYRTGIYRRFFRDRALIVLFHRVDDRLAGDPLSCTSAEFDAYCQFFKRYFVVISLGELIRRLRSGISIERCLVITFDDGYRDNREVAARLLHRHGLPACFFITTDFVESNVVPWWDESLPFAPEWMDWVQVRELATDGFELGAHTMTHVDLGVVPEDVARTEITGSRDRLEQELGTTPPFFSYPYGRAHQITEANRQLVIAAGFACCLSAYGGSVRANADPFRLHRIAISPWFFSPHQFGWEAMVSRE